VYVTLPALPLTPHGKLDRAALPRPDTDRPGLAGEFTPPRTGTETVVAGLCADLLGLRRVGVDDDFFALGGHSLLAMRLVSQVNRACGVDVPLRRFLRVPTVAVLAAAVDEAVDEADGRGASDITPGARRRDERLLARVDQLTDEQVERLLSEMTDSETVDSETVDSEAER
jgi:acyl carrier protein